MKPLRCCWTLALLLVLLFTGSACRIDQSNEDTHATYRPERQHSRFSRPHHRNHQHYKAKEFSSTDADHTLTESGIPIKVHRILDYVRTHGHAPVNYVGGRIFGNFEHRLPRTDASSRRIRYREWDVNPKEKGSNRGAERLITGSDDRAYYTADHYNSFVEIK